MKVVIVIVTYNGMPWIEKCLHSCSNYSVIIVDNASTDNTILYIKNKYPKVTVVPQSKNLGFGAANNIGISYALQQDCDYVFLLNQDAYIVAGCVEGLIKEHQNNPNYGVLSPVHFNGKGTQLDTNFTMFLKRYKVNDTILYDSFSNSLKEVYPIAFVNAAAWLLPRKTLEEIGGFDPLFFHYGEDHNYCQRILFHNYSIGIVAKSIVLHDREDREVSEMISYSNKYYEEYERYAKVEWADVNLDDFDKKYHLKVEVLFKTVLKSILRLNFTKFKDSKKKMQILKRINPQLLRSREQNVTKNNSYLD